MQKLWLVAVLAVGACAGDDEQPIVQCDQASWGMHGPCEKRCEFKPSPVMTDTFCAFKEQNGSTTGCADGSAIIEIDGERGCCAPDEDPAHYVTVRWHVCGQLP